MEHPAVRLTTRQVRQLYRQGRWGDAVAVATKAVGVRPCAGCRKRQAALNAVGAAVGRLLPGGPAPS